MTMLTALQWQWPWAFLLMLLPLAFVLLSVRQGRRVVDYAEAALRPWALNGRPQAGLGRKFLHLGAWLLLAAALAGPRLPVTSQNAAVPERHDVRVMALLDLSDSMHAADIAPTRAERARLKLHDLPDVLAGESLGLAVFAGTAGVVMPPSADAAVFRYALEHSEHLLDDAPGSELAVALDAAARGLPKSGTSGRAILLVTDGESDMVRGNAVLNAVEKLREADIQLFILGIATEQGAPIPNGAGGFQQLDDQPSQDQPFQSRMDSSALTEMAQRTGGLFVPVSDGDDDLRTLAKAIHALPSHPAPGTSRTWNELFYWPLLLGTLLLLMAYRPPTRSPDDNPGQTSHPAHPSPDDASLHPGDNPPHRRKQRSHTRSSLPGALLIFAGLFTLTPHEVRAETQASLATAYAAWQRGDFVQAQLLYANLPGAQARMGEGAAAYRRGDFNHAAQNFSSAWLLSNSDSARADALYNLGNAELQAGRSERAVAAYEQVLKLRPNDENAASNLWLAQQSAAAKQMKKSRPEDPPGRKPTDFARYNEDVTTDFPPDDPKSGGDLSAGGAGAGQKRPAGEPAALALSEADRLAAEKKMELLDDQPNPAWRAMLRRDTPERKSEGLPW
jgi:Ca-activated chloride channel family protein